MRRKRKRDDRDEFDRLMDQADVCWKIAGIALGFVLVCKILVLILTLLSY